MTTVRVTIKATIPRAEQSGPEPVRASWEDRRAFWDHLRNSSNIVNVREQSDETFELILQQNFGRILKQKIISYFEDSWSGLRQNNLEELPLPKAISILEAERRALALIYFRAFDVEYGSLKFNVDITGFEKIVELFDHNFDLFKMVMYSYIPLAFDQSIPYISTTTQNPLLWELEVSEDIKSKFSKSLTSIPQPAEQTVSEVTERVREARLRDAWFIANTSLIVPVFLAFVVAYFLYQNIASQSQIAETRMQKLLDFQMTSLEKERERTDTYRKIEDKLIEKALSGK